MTVGELLVILENYELDQIVGIWDTRLEFFDEAVDLSIRDGRVLLGPAEEYVTIRRRKR
jgi:hypothetical protein